MCQRVNVMINRNVCVVNHIAKLHVLLVFQFETYLTMLSFYILFKFTVVKNLTQLICYCSYVPIVKDSIFICYISKYFSIIFV